MIKEVEQAITREGKFVKSYPIEIFDTTGDLCVTAQNEVYIRNLNFTKPLK